LQFATTVRVINRDRAVTHV